MEMNISPVHKFQYRFKKDMLKFDKQENMMKFISYEFFVFLLIALVTYNICGNISEQKWVLLVFNLLILILDIVLSFYFAGIYRKNRDKYRLRERLLDELFSGRYEDVLTKCDDLETELRLLELQTAKDIANKLEENNEKVDLHSIIRW